MAITTLGQAIQSTGLVEGDFGSLSPRGDNTRVFNMSKANPAHNTYTQDLPKRLPGLASPSVIKQTYKLIKILQMLYLGWKEVIPPAMVSRHSSETKDSSSRTISHGLHSSLLQNGCLNAQIHAKISISPRPKYYCQRTHEGKMFVPSLLTRRRTIQR